MKEFKRYQVKSILIDERYNRTFVEEEEIVLAENRKDAVEKIQSSRGKKIVMYIKELEINPVNIPEEAAKYIMNAIFGK